MKGKIALPLSSVDDFITEAAQNRTVSCPVIINL